MEVLLLGTGGPRGWPEPSCSCASCSTAVSTRTSRAPACALVDDVLLLDGHEGLTRAAADAGRDLSAVRRVLLTGTQDLPRDWLDSVGGAAPVQVLGPPAALAALRAPGERLRLVPVAPGDHRPATTGYEVSAVKQRSGLAWIVVGPDRKRLLYAPGPGRVDIAAGEDAYDLVLLGLGPSGGRPASEEGAAATLARLRQDGLVQPTTDVCAIGHDHHADLPDVLHHHLTAWGVRSPADGTATTLGPSAPEQCSVRGRTLVLGGARSGKSALAERLLAAHPHVRYVATGGSRAGDDEWRERIALHRARRPPSWETVETTDLTTYLLEADRPVLIDCLGTWLTALLDRHEVWDGGSLTAVDVEVEELLAAWRAASTPVVAVSNEVGSGVVPATASGRLFRDLLGRVNAQVAAASETVLLTVAGVPLPLRTATRA